MISYDLTSQLQLLEALPQASVKAGQVVAETINGDLFAHFQTHACQSFAPPYFKALHKSYCIPHRKRKTNLLI